MVILVIMVLVVVVVAVETYFGNLALISAETESLMPLGRSFDCRSRRPHLMGGPICAIEQDIA